jgi:hypothetical protein
VIYGLSNDTRAHTLTIAFPEELSLELLVVRVTATEALTVEALEANDTSPEFYFQVEAEEPEPEPEPEPEVEREYSVPWLLLAILVAVIAVVAAVAMVVVNQETGPVHPSQATSPPPSSCPECGRPVTTDNAFGQPYCSECDRFL